MAFRSHTASPAGSASPSPSSSSNISPYITPAPLDNMVAADDKESSYNPNVTVNQPAACLSRPLNSGKGGCWTCRVRRKKCDEQREDDSCKTCKRLMIKCLGWGPKRPDWMRDKKNVDAYKASIKAQLSRAGLIRGQPRNPLHVPPHRGVNQSRQSLGHSHTPPSNIHRSSIDTYPLNDTTYSQNHNDHWLPSMAGNANSLFDPLARSFDSFDPASFQYQSPLNTSYNQPLGPDGLIEPNLSLLPNSPNDPLFNDNSIISPYHMPPGQIVAHEDLVMYYFNDVRKAQCFFAGDASTDITYSAIVEEPRGAVTLAICALADLHLKQMRISRGLEPPNQSPEKASTNYLRHEALLQLEQNKNTHGCWRDNDAIAAFHLVILSQLSGGGTDWEEPFAILCQWLVQLNLQNSENPFHALLSHTETVQHYVKMTLWLDIFSSFSALRPPKFILLWENLLSERHQGSNFWQNGDLPKGMGMEALTGCPDDAMLAIAEVSALAHWKANELRNGRLSYPELIRRGTLIEQQLRRFPGRSSAEQHLRLRGMADVTKPTEEERTLVACIFRDTASLYLHTVLSNATPGVPEITQTVEDLVRLFTRLPHSELDRSLVFPICLAGCMTNDSSRRDFFKGRIRSLNESYGNLLQTRRLMEAVWQKRDVGGKEIDVRETIREQGLNLLLI